MEEEGRVAEPVAQLDRRAGPVAGFGLTRNPASYQLESKDQSRGAQIQGRGQFRG